MNDAVVAAGAPVASFELNAKAGVLSTPTVRRFVADLCGRTLASPDATSKVVVAVHELLDNAVRYCADAVRIRIDVRRSEAEAAVSIETRNRTTLERWQAVDSLLREMRSASGRASFFRSLLDRVASGAEGAGLGLGRVYAEADFDLHGRLEGDEVILLAHARFAAAWP